MEFHFICMFPIFWIRVFTNLEISGRDHKFKPLQVVWKFWATLILFLRANGLRIEIEVVQNAPAAPEKERTR